MPEKPHTSMSLDREKSELRETAQAVRRRSAEESGPHAAASLSDHLVARFGYLGGRAVSGYLAIGTEIDVAPALARLEQAGLHATLPVVTSREQSLTFRRWTAGTQLEPGPLRTRHPAAESPEMVPDLLIIPMLAFDANGYRIGWGGGFYDRTLAKLRVKKEVIAIGAAFAAQQVDKIPHDHHDARLDWIATETGLIEITPDT